MSRLPQFFGLDLEMHDPDTVITARADLPKVSDSGETHIVRDVDPAGFSSLGHTLKVVEQRFKALEETCGVRVVDHRWGLLPVDPATRRWIPQYTQPRVPRNHLLVARVEVINNFTPLSKPEAELLEDNLGPWQARLAQRGEARAYDVKPVQFGTGENPDNEHATWLVDVDPRLDIGIGTKPTIGVLNKVRTVVEYLGDR